MQTTLWMYVKVIHNTRWEQSHVTAALLWWRTEITADVGTRALSALLVYIDFTDIPRIYLVNFIQMRDIPALCDIIENTILITGVVNE